MKSTSNILWLRTLEATLYFRRLSSFLAARRRHCHRPRRSVRRPRPSASVASYLLSAALTPSLSVPLGLRPSVRPSVRSFRGVAHSLTPLVLSPLVRSFVRSLSRSSTKPHHRCTFVRSLRSSLSFSLSLSLIVSRSRSSFILAASNADPFSLCSGKLKPFCQKF